MEFAKRTRYNGSKASTDKSVTQTMTNILDCNEDFVQHVFIKVVSSVDFRQVPLEVLETKILIDNANRI